MKSDLRKLMSKLTAELRPLAAELHIRNAIASVRAARLLIAESRRAPEPAGGEGAGVRPAIAAAPVKVTPAFVVLPPSDLQRLHQEHFHGE